MISADDPAGTSGRGGDSINLTDRGNLSAGRAAWRGPVAGVLLACSFAAPAAAAPVAGGVGQGALSGAPPATVDVPATPLTPQIEAKAGGEGVTVTSPSAPPLPVTPPKLETTTPVATPTPKLEEVPHVTESLAGESVPRARSSTKAAATPTAVPTNPAGRGAGRPHRARSSATALGTGRRPVTATRPAARGAAPAPAGSGLSLAAPLRAAGHTAGHAAAKSGHGPEGSGNPLASIGGSLGLPLPVPDWSKPIILLLALLALGLAARWWLASRRARALERRERILLRDIETMQAALVPEVPERIGGLAVSVAYRPAEGPAAGGDFYDVLALDGERVAVILGDVAGHGHDALRQAALTRYTLRAFLKETGDPRQTLRLAGHALSEPGVEQLATVAVALFDAAHGTLTFALAGHPPPILTGAAAADAPAHCSSPPLGCDLPTGRRQRTVNLPAGARACLFSDGLIEARCSPRGSRHPELLGRTRLVELVAELPPTAGARELLAAVRAEAAATPDDMAACILTSENDAPTPVIDIEELEIDARALDGGGLAAYLREAGLAETAGERVLRACRTQLTSRETALVVVDRAGGMPAVRVRPGRERPAQSRRWVTPAETRLQRA